MPRPTQAERGALVVTMDIREAGSAQRGTVRQSAEDVLRLAERAGIRCTWAIPAPESSELAAAARSMTPLQEVALAAEEAWAGVDVARHRLGAELRRRVRAARAGGCPIAAVVGGSAALADAHDLLVREGVVARCEGGVSVTDSQPRMLRHGLWEIPVSVELDGGSTIGSWRGMRRLRQSIERLVTTRETLHVIVREGELRKRGTTVLGPIVEHAKKLASRDGLAIETLGEAARRSGTVQRTEPAQSILRRRAA